MSFDSLPEKIPMTYSPEVSIASSQTEETSPNVQQTPQTLSITFQSVMMIGLCGLVFSLGWHVGGGITNKIFKGNVPQSHNIYLNRNFFSKYPQDS
jgi:hypothetical protein